MKRILLGLLLSSLLISCSKDSSSTQAAPGKDGLRQLATLPMVYKEASEATMAQNINWGAVDWKTGDDLLLEISYDPSTDLPVDTTFENIDVSAYLPKPLPKGLCYLKNVNHHWKVSDQGMFPEYKSGQDITFQPSSMFIISVETKDAPSTCTKVIFGFTVTKKAPPVQDAPTPQPTPAATPAPVHNTIPGFPQDAETVILVGASDSENFGIVYEKNGTNNFKYDMKMQISGNAFGGSQKVDKVFVAVYDKVYMKFVSPWTQIASHEKAELLPREYRLKFTLDQFSAPAFFIDRQKDLVLAFAINSDTNSPLPLRYLELGKYCNIYAHSFVETETGDKGCN